MRVMTTKDLEAGPQIATRVERLDVRIDSLQRVVYYAGIPLIVLIVGGLLALLIGIILK